MAKFSLKNATVSIAGTSSCVTDGNIDFGSLNLVETTCTSDETKTYEPGTFEAASGSVTVNDTTALTDWLTAYGTGTTLPSTTTILFTWADTGAATISVTGYITNVTLPSGIDASFTASFNFKGTGAITFTP
jgi:hypothetical protein